MKVLSNTSKKPVVQTNHHTTLSIWRIFRRISKIKIIRISNQLTTIIITIITIIITITTIIITIINQTLIYLRTKVQWT